MRILAFLRIVMEFKARFCVWIGYLGYIDDGFEFHCPYLCRWSIINVGFVIMFRLSAVLVQAFWIGEREWQHPMSDVGKNAAFLGFSYSANFPSLTFGHRSGGINRTWTGAK